jgi:hypothetical protein
MNEPEKAKREPPPQETDPPRVDAPKRDFPTAGPHARRELTNKMATPGAGALPDPDEEGDSQTSTG